MFHQFPGVLEFCLNSETKAEIKPVEPDQGNACAGKVVCLYFSTLRSRSISFKSIFFHSVALPCTKSYHEKIAFGDLLLFFVVP